MSYGSVLAIAIAIHHGFNVALLAGMATYAVAFIVAKRIPAER